MIRYKIFAHLSEPSAWTIDLLTSELSFSSLLVGTLIAFGLGGFHALSPGHGKTLATAYLVGSQATPRQAILLGLTTTISHTLGVFILGLVALFASKYVLSEQLYPLITVVSGVIIIGVGVNLVRKRLQGHDHDHHHHHHHHEVKNASLLKVGIAGGLIPCPSALVLLLAAVALHRIGYGLVLVGGFSLGLAFVLMTLGLIAVYTRDWLEGLPKMNQVLETLSISSAILVVLLGIVLTLTSTTYVL